MYKFYMKNNRLLAYIFINFDLIIELNLKYGFFLRSGCDGNYRSSFTFIA